MRNNNSNTITITTITTENETHSIQTNTNTKKKRKYNYITEKERYFIEYLYNVKKLNIHQISKELGREYSTIYREIKKGTVTQRRYDLSEYETYKADYSQSVTCENLSNRGKTMKCTRNCSFLVFMEEKIIKERYSPRAGLVLYKKATGKQPVCLNTVYNYIYNGNVTRIKPKHLPYYRKKTKKRIKEYRKVSLRNVVCQTIEERDKSILSRADFGHWEMDTVIGTQKSKPCLLVLTERKARIEIVRKLKNKKAESVVNALNKLEKELGNVFPDVFKTITCDNGVEFSDTIGINQSSFTKCSRTDLYYCHPYCSSERGSNENQNKLVRRKYPKGYDFSKVSDKDIITLQRFINSYPRELFDDSSSIEYLRSEEPYYYDLLKKVL